MNSQNTSKKRMINESRWNRTVGCEGAPTSRDEKHVSETTPCSKDGVDQRAKKVQGVELTRMVMATARAIFELEPLRIPARTGKLPVVSRPGRSRLSLRCDLEPRRVPTRTGMPPVVSASKGL